MWLAKDLNKDTEAFEKQVTSTAECSVNVTDEVDTQKMAPQLDVDKADGTFLCKLCSFSSKWTKGLEVHVTMTHSKSQKHDTALNDKYRNTVHYWKNGWLGSVYQSF